MAADVLIMIHLLGLMLASGGALGGLVTLASAAPASRQKGGPRGPGRLYARIAIAGLILLWPTGIVMLATRPAGDALSVMFWMKMVFAGALTFAVVTTEMTYARTKAGDKRAGGVLASLAPLSGIALVIALVFSVLAFH